MPIASGVDFREAVEAPSEGGFKAGPIAVGLPVELMEKTAECSGRSGATRSVNRCGGSRRRDWRDRKSQGRENYGAFHGSRITRPTHPSESARNSTVSTQEL